MIYHNILEMIGNTPILKLNNIVQKSKFLEKQKSYQGIQVFAKIEGLNPGGSIKDRVGLQMIEEGEKNGKLTKNKTIIEATSGNTGIALAMIGAIKGYQVEVVMSEAVSIERQKLIQAFGAKIILTNAEKGTDGAILHVQKLVKKNPDQYFYPDQYSNMANQNAHFNGTAMEIIKQTKGEIDYFVASLGTSGTLMGIGRKLKEYNSKIKIISAEPVVNHYIQGLKNMQEALNPQIYDKSVLDDVIMIDSEDAFGVARELIRLEGISVGMSSGAAMLAVLKLINKINKNKARIVTIFPDRGEKYLSTSLFDFIY